MTRPSWQPMLTGRLASRAWVAIDTVVSNLHLRSSAESPPGSSDGTLATGSAGLAVFFSYLSRVRDREANEQTALDHLESALSTLEHTRLHLGLFGGFAGIGWTYSHLVGRIFGEPDDRVFEPVNSALAELLDRAPLDDEYDLIGGLVGYGVYALEQEPSVCDRILEPVVARLAETAERRGSGATWFTPPSRLSPEHAGIAPSGYYDLGVAHGVPGVIALLARAVRHGGTDTATGLLTGAIEWLDEQRLAPDAEAAFGYWTADGHPPAPARLAWCYGDSGIAAAWLSAARATGRNDWEQDALAIAHRGAARTFASSGVVDAGLCHGAAGVAHIFNRLFQATGDDVCREAAQRWFEHALEIAETTGAPPDGDVGFLTGSAGVGLALLAACTDVEPAWDRVLLLDVAGRGSVA